MVLYSLFVLITKHQNQQKQLDEHTGLIPAKAVYFQTLFSKYDFGLMFHFQYNFRFQKVILLF